MTRIHRAAALAALAAACACSADAPKRERAAAPASPPPSASTETTKTASGDTLDFARWVLRADGVGPVRVGMSVTDADSAVSGGLDRTTGLAECDYVRPKLGPDGVALMVERGQIVRADVGDSARVTTALGVLPGDAESRVLEAYPGARVQPHKYVQGHYIIVIPNAPADTLHRLVFETEGGVVTRMRGGLHPQVEYVEGCS